MTGGERRVAQPLEDKLGDDGVPLVNPTSCGREGQAPILIKVPSLREEACAIADQLSQAHKEGHAWGDMAIEYKPAADAIQIMTMKVSKGLEFPVVALPGVGHMPAKGEDEQEAARVFYVAATRASPRLAIGVVEARLVADAMKANAVNTVQQSWQ